MIPKRESRFSGEVFRLFLVARALRDVQKQSPGNRPGLDDTQLTASWLQATFFIAFSTPLLNGSAVSVATFWARAESSLPCAVSVSNCERECAVVSSTSSDGDLTPNR